MSTRRCVGSVPAKVSCFLNLEPETAPRMIPQLKTRSVPALERGLGVLELVARSNGGLTLTELSHTLHLPRSSTHCLLVTLQRHGYLTRNNRTGRYLFAVKLFDLANATLNVTELRVRALPLLRSLMEKTHLTVHMASLEQYEAVVIAKIEPPGLLRLASWIGKRMDVHCTGVGKALIAFLPEEELNYLVHEHGLPRHNENTITSISRLKEELAKVRRLDYAFDDEEDEIGLRCIGAPVFEQAGRVVASVSVAGTVRQIHPRNRRLIAEQVQQTASAISRELGFHHDA
jgi:DNA-binding IclR family transcriptional regulator